MRHISKGMCAHAHFKKYICLALSCCYLPNWLYVILLLFFILTFAGTAALQSQSFFHILVTPVGRGWSCHGTLQACLPAEMSCCNVNLVMTYYHIILKDSLRRFLMSCRSYWQDMDSPMKNKTVATLHAFYISVESIDRVESIHIM